MSAQLERSAREKAEAEGARWRDAAEKSAARVRELEASAAAPAAPAARTAARGAGAAEAALARDMHRAIGEMLADGQLEVALLREVTPPSPRTNRTRRVPHPVRGVCRPARAHAPRPARLRAPRAPVAAVPHATRGAARSASGVPRRSAGGRRRVATRGWRGRTGRAPARRPAGRAATAATTWHLRPRSRSGGRSAAPPLTMKNLRDNYKHNLSLRQPGACRGSPSPRGSDGLIKRLFRSAAAARRRRDARDIVWDAQHQAPRLHHPPPLLLQALSLTAAGAGGEAAQPRAAGPCAASLARWNPSTAGNGLSLGIAGPDRQKALPARCIAFAQTHTDTNTNSQLSVVKRPSHTYHSSQ